jgi:integral membrane sensor domain MASE1
LLAVGLLHWAGFRSELDRLRDALALVLLGALTSMTVSAGLGTAALLMDGTISRSGVASTWALWWAGDAAITPVASSQRRQEWVDTAQASFTERFMLRVAESLAVRVTT